MRSLLIVNRLRNAIIKSRCREQPNFLRHREDKTALRAYLNRLGDRLLEMITTVDDPDFDARIEAAILQEMRIVGSN